MTAAPPTSEHSAESDKSIVVHSLWAVPMILASCGLGLLLWKNKSWGADAAAAISIPITVSGIIVQVLAQLGKLKLGTPPPAMRARRAKRAILAFTVSALLLSGALWQWKREPSPFDYLSGEVRIGYLDHDYPGWHEAVHGAPSGFDVSIANSIAAYFKDARIVWIPLQSLQDRENALRGRWRATLPDGKFGDWQDPVKLVISNYSMTPARAEVIDFVGPYFVDSQGFLARRAIAGLEDLAPGKVCVLSGSTSAAKLAQKGWHPVERQSLSLCLQLYSSGRVDAVTDDRSLLEGYASRNGYPRPIPLGYGSEKYGVGIPNNMPRLCAALSKVLNDFIQYEWRDEFSVTLAKVGVSTKNPPAAVDPCEKTAPWERM